MGFLWTNQEQVEEPKVGRAEDAHKLLVEAKMDYNKCVSKIEAKIAREFARIFDSPVDIEYLGNEHTYSVNTTRNLFRVGDLDWRMDTYNSYVVSEKPYHYFSVKVDDGWKSVERPADLWIALGYGE